MFRVYSHFIKMLRKCHINANNCFYLIRIFLPVQRLLSDAQTGRINLIICKDLSRFGRNYIEVGQYIDYIFPLHNIRFIALNDNVDTANRDSNAMEMMPVINFVSAL